MGFLGNFAKVLAFFVIATYNESNGNADILHLP